MVTVAAPVRPKVARRSALILAGIVCGASIWGTYGLLEYVFYTMTLVRSENSILTDEFWAANAMLVGSYIAVGALIGFALALLLGATTSHKLAIVGFLTAATLTVSQIPHYVILMGKITPIVGLLLICLLGQILGVLYAQNFPVLRLFSGAVPLSLILLSRRIGELLSSTHSALARAVFVCVVILIAAMWYRRRPFRVGGNLNLMASAGILVALIGTSAIATVLTAPAAPRDPVIAPAGGPGSPNVILLVMDTVRADHLSVYGCGRSTAANLQKFADRATLYTHCFAVSDVTLTTHASLFTGLYPEWHGAHYAPPKFPKGFPLSNGTRTLSKMLSKAGYVTLGVVANKYFLKPVSGLSQGFEYYDWRAPISAISRPEQFSQSFRRVLSYVLNTATLDWDTRTAADENAEALRLIGSAAKAKRPFFLFLNYMEAHIPYVPGPGFWDRYRGRDRHFTMFDMVDLRTDVRARRRLPTPHERDHFISQYDGCITRLDAGIGRFIQQLKDRGMYDNSLIIITADHGEAFGERYRLEHSSSVYQDQIAVPLIIKFPYSNEKRVVDTNVSQIDILPTILAAVSLPRVSGAQGVDLRQIATAGNRPLFSTSFEPNFSPDAPSMKRTEYAIVSGSYKLIASTRGSTELFDLALDRNEQSDTSRAQPATVKELRASLDAHIRSAPKPRMYSTPTAENLQQLKSLGYVQ